jgi:SpoVK/Ycf46/Vps4 family AAA+-type ATPase
MNLFDLIVNKFGLGGNGEVINDTLLNYYDLVEVNLEDFTHKKGLIEVNNELIELRDDGKNIILKKKKARADYQTFFTIGHEIENRVTIFNGNTEEILDLDDSDGYYSNIIEAFKNNHDQQNSQKGLESMGQRIETFSSHEFSESTTKHHLMIISKLNSISNEKNEFIVDNFQNYLSKSSASDLLNNLINYIQFRYCRFESIMYSGINLYLPKTYNRQKIEKAKVEEKREKKEKKVPKKVSSKAFEGYFGYPKLVKSFKNAIDLFVEGDIFEEFMDSEPNQTLRILLWGPPGTGKTMFMTEAYKYIEEKTKKSEKKFEKFVFKLSDIATSLYMGAEKNLNDFLNKIEEHLSKSDNNYAYLEIDELDQIATKRSERSSSTDKSDNALVTLLLQYLSNKELTRRTVIVTATNHYDRIDSAFTRPERIDQTFYIGHIEDKDQIKIMTNYLLQKNGFNPSSLNTQVIIRLNDCINAMFNTNQAVPAMVSSFVKALEFRAKENMNNRKVENYLHLKQIQIQNGDKAAQKAYIELFTKSLTAQDIEEMFKVSIKLCANVVLPEMAKLENDQINEVNEKNENEYYYSDLTEEEQESVPAGHYLSKDTNGIYTLKPTLELIKKRELGIFK